MFPFECLIESIAVFSFPISFFGIFMWTFSFCPHFLSLLFILSKMFYSFNFCFNLFLRLQTIEYRLHFFFICTIFGESFHYHTSEKSGKLNASIEKLSPFTQKKRVYDLWMPFMKATTQTFLLIKSMICCMSIYSNQSFCWKHAPFDAIW